MNTTKKLISLVESQIPLRILGTEGISCKELAKKLDRAPSHIAQVLNKLCMQGKIVCIKEKRNVQRKVSIYYKLPKNHSFNQELAKQEKRQTCGNCQKYSGIHRCILLDLAYDEAPWVLPKELRERVEINELPRNTPACEFYDPRVNGHRKSNNINDFIKMNTEPNSYDFKCPISRCKKVIEKFSFSLQQLKLGSNTFYCPHCSSPMIFTYNKARDRYEIQYWDAHFDILQEHYFTFTGLQLPSRHRANTSYGVSIAKPGSFYLDLPRGILYVGRDATVKELIHSKDLTFFPLRELGYIAVNDWDDYFYLEEKLHAIVPSTNKKLYENITLLPPGNKIESPSPLEKELGGNEIIIATDSLNLASFGENLSAREALLKKTAYEVGDSNIKSGFSKALIGVRRKRQEYSRLATLDFRQWLQFEGGCGSLMFEPFKQEARKYGFKAPSREQARMVRWEPFLPYGHYYARSPYHSLLNGINQVIISVLKKEVYNEIPLAWKGLRGWCHRNYPQGLLYDKSEQPKLVGLFCANRAIRNGLIEPNDFVKRRGKRYEVYYCVLPEMELYRVIQQIGQEALHLQVSLANGQTLTLKNAYRKYLLHLKELLNTLAHYSVDLLTETEATKGKRVTLWKKLQRTQNKDFLTTKERQQLQLFTERFFSEVFAFEPLCIMDIY